MFKLWIQGSCSIKKRWTRFERNPSSGYCGELRQYPGGGLEKDKKLGFAFLPFLFILLILFLLPFFRPSTPRLRLTHSTNTINKNQIKKINSIYSLFIDFHLLPLLRFCLPSRTVILLTEITYFAHLYPNDPFPCHFRTREPPI